jgi:hypothetical protein
MSGYGSEDDLQASREAWFPEHLTEPVNATKLGAAIRRVTSANGAAGVAGSAPAEGFCSKGLRPAVSDGSFNRTRGVQRWTSTGPFPT